MAVRSIGDILNRLAKVRRNMASPDFGHMEVVTALHDLETEIQAFALRVSAEIRTTEPPPDEPDDIEKAYGLLWLIPETDRRAAEARKLLLTLLSREGKLRGVKWAIDRTDDLEGARHG